jgi:hypothetical protein
MNPTLIRIDVKAGHGAGKSVAATIQENVDIQAFTLLIWDSRNYLNQIRIFYRYCYFLLSAVSLVANPATRGCRSSG